MISFPSSILIIFCINLVGYLKMCYSNFETTHESWWHNRDNHILCSLFTVFSKQKERKKEIVKMAHILRHVTVVCLLTQNAPAASTASHSPLCCFPLLQTHFIQVHSIINNNSCTLLYFFLPFLTYHAFFSYYLCVLRKRKHVTHLLKTRRNYLSLKKEIIYGFFLL